MNSMNQFLLGFNTVYMLYHDVVSLKWMILLTFLFAVLLDENQRWGRRKGQPEHHERTWIEEPLGLILFGVPMGLLFGLIQAELFWVTIIVYAAHILLDYLTIHEVCPLAPFSNKTAWVGVFRSWPEAKWYKGDEKGLSENWFMLIMLAWLFAIVLF